MAIISICFSGHTRGFLNLKSDWANHFDFLRERHELRIFFHSWSNVGTTTKRATGGTIEGTYDSSKFRHFDELLDFLVPNGFSIASLEPEFETIVDAFPSVYLTSSQAPKRPILSQIYSVVHADLIRQEYDRKHVPSDVVIKLRFDLVPHHRTLDEIDFIVANPVAPVIFVPSPSYHYHPGGGGGCVVCSRFFQDHVRRPDFGLCLAAFLAQHGVHGNDICDLYAMASPGAMTEYVRVLQSSDAVYKRILSAHRTLGVERMAIRPDDDDPRDIRITDWRDHTGGVELLPTFYPEKILRFGLTSHLLLHSESVFKIYRP